MSALKVVLSEAQAEELASLFAASAEDTSQ